MSLPFVVQKLDGRIGELRAARIRGRAALGSFQVIRPGQAATNESLSVGGSYRAAEETVTLVQRVTVPEKWAGRRVFLALEFGGAETLVYIDGKPAQAIDRQHHDLLLAQNAVGGKECELTLEAYTGTPDAQRQGGWSGAGDAESDVATISVQLKSAELQWIDDDANALYYDLKVAVDAAKTMDANSREYVAIISVADQTVKLLDFSLGTASDAFYSSVSAAEAYIQKELYAKYHADPDFAPTLWATGHAHIDTAWLWRLAHTRKKCERTFTTAVALMDQYPDYHFSCSQPQQYAYVKEDNPAVFEKIKAAIKRGQWEPVGGMWVESDCNVVSGESLVRQFLIGQRFFEKEFGARTDVVWLPDVFGYSAAFPQIIKKAGMKYFMTIKIYWNQFNKPPYQTFEWEGLDGSTVLTHFSPLGDYNAAMTPEQWARTWSEYKQKDVSDSALYIYGYGDGGGGPTRNMLETAQRGKDFPGMPKVKLTTNGEFFKDLETQAAANGGLPRWVGELYLEYHRGTYTTQARNKRANRQSEILLQTAEQISSLASLRTDSAYAQGKINKAWELTLLNQFHDIIPGSSIHAVYEDSARDYAQILGIARDAVSESLAALASAVDAPADSVLVYNPLSWTRADVARVPVSLGLAGQNVTDFDGSEYTLASLANVPSLGYAVAAPAKTGSDEDLAVSEDRLENRFFTMTFDENGEISSLFDKRSSREVIDSTSYCKGNSLLMFEDKPMNYDAWDIDIFYQDKMSPLQTLSSRRVVETGPIRATVEVTRKFGRGSTITQRISMYRDLPRIDFDTQVDWQERQVLLKAAFPVNVHSSRATYDIQFGNVERPTHWNTSWDSARFEVCGHKWADLSEGDYGVSILSDCKYGWDIKGNVMRLTLLRGPIQPDPEADLGQHRFTYSLYPHRGDWRTAETVRRAYELNVPVQIAKTPSASTTQSAHTLPSTYSFVEPSVSSLIIETVKKAEDDDGLIIRLYESQGTRGKASLAFASPLKSAVEVNLMEVETDETKESNVVVNGAQVGIDYRPYEIKTLKVTL
jgi:alpha-mannosidase